MRYDYMFKHPTDVAVLLKKMEELTLSTGPLRFMEVCGTHTMAIARSGIKSILPPSIQLISGPGCPVCVTPMSIIDMVLDLSLRPNVLITSYGDLLRVPGSKQGDNLLRRKAAGSKVEAVYSPMDALQIAASHPELEVVFLGVGFETTAPGTAACILEAADQNLTNFSVLCLLKRTEPALRSLIESPDFAVNGFLCPGHVAAVIGSNAFSFLSDEYYLPGVVSGFEAGDLLYSILELTRMAASHRPALKNEYSRLVHSDGNPIALQRINDVFYTVESDWRGLGRIPQSGYAIKADFAQWDAWKKFSLHPASSKLTSGCCCAQIIRGTFAPKNCPLFGTVCSPDNPVGPCMVSGEGACAAAYQYEL